MKKTARLTFSFEFNYFLSINLFHSQSNASTCTHRERVPFVLTEDFIRVIAKGNENAIKSEEFLKWVVVVEWWLGVG